VERVIRLKGELNVTADALSRISNEKIALLIENITGINEAKAKDLLEKRPSYFLAQPSDDILDYEIVACIHEHCCPTSVQRLTLPSNDERARKIVTNASLYAIKPENKILYRVSKLNPEDSDVSYRRCVPLTKQ